MKLTYLMLVPVLLAGCTARSRYSDHTNADTTRAAPDEKLSAYAIAGDSTTCIDLVYRFNETNELYVSVFYKESVAFGEIEQLQRKADSVVYRANGIKRTKMPAVEAIEYFDLRGLDRVAFFDSAGNRVGSGKLKRVELVEDEIGSQFAAVLETTGPVPAGVAYCIGNDRPAYVIPDFHVTQIAHDSLKETIFATFNISDAHVWNVHHLKTAGSVYSVVSADTTAYIVAAETDTLQLLYSSPYSEVITRALPVARTVNGRPVFLTESGVPETDMMWTALLVFNGQRYEVCRNNRVNLNAAGGHAGN